MKGIDVAKWNGVIDWKKVKNAGVQFAIIKAINKQCKVEDAFDRNYAGALSVGLPIDVYNYSYATTETKTKTDAQAVLNAIKGKNIGTVWLDVEDKTLLNLGMTLIDNINAYKKVIEDAGFNFGVYTGLSFYNTNIKPFHEFLDCKFWIARYPVSKLMQLSDEPLASYKPAIMHTLTGWQYTSNGSVDGITGAVDLSMRYDTTTTIKSAESKYTVGKNYTLQNNMNVRKTANGEIKMYTDLTASAKSHAIKQADGSAVLGKGTVVTCKGVETVNGATWMKIPSGYVCAVGSDKTVYIE